MPLRRRAGLLVGGLLALGVVAVPASTAAAPVPLAPPIPEARHERARVLRVVDGDTIKVRLRSRPRAHVRLLGIDTPEVYGGTQCYGPEASAAAKKMLPRAPRAPPF